ncbi:hypothetical protein [Aquimarina agarilytica]|nr:hypothetical protein [Aquimarina agarilytica]
MRKNLSLGAEISSNWLKCFELGNYKKGGVLWIGFLKEKVTVAI